MNCSRSRLSILKLILLANTDARVATIESTIGKICNSVSDGDTVFFMFAGHGFGYSENGRTLGLCLTSEFDGSLEPGESGSFSLANIRDWFKFEHKKLDIIVVLDSCFSGNNVGLDRDRLNAPNLSDGRSYYVRTIPRDIDWPRDDIAFAIPDFALAWDGSAYAIITSTKRNMPALENPSSGHGIFSEFLFEWWETNFLANGTADFGGESLEYIESRLQETTDLETQLPLFQSQCPDRQLNGQIEVPIRFLHKVATTQRRVRSIRNVDFCSLMPPGDIDKFENHDELHAARSELVDSLVTEEHDHKNRTVLVRGPAFSGKIELLSHVVKSLKSRELANTPILFLSASYQEIALPVILSIYNNTSHRISADLFREEDVYIRSARLGVTRRLVRYLSSSKAKVIIGIRSELDKTDIADFIRECVRDPEIQVCSALSMDSSIPSCLQVEDERFNRSGFNSPKLASYLQF